ncbi:MAG: hypothetical protein NZ518_11490 [Dehalococcoidia bacterium]|nr:hypothetical protein [Dehalococcoidia bacterium]
MRTAEDVALLRQWRVDAMLIGEALMTAPDPGRRAAEFVQWGANALRAVG